jgi:hypothetical protein
MYENQLAMTPSTSDYGILAKRKPDITVGENLDARIADLEARLQELKDTKQRIEATGLLTARIDDLQRAMSY